MTAAKNHHGNSTGGGGPTSRKQAAAAYPGLVQRGESGAELSPARGLDKLGIEPEFTGESLSACARAGQIEGKADDAAAWWQQRGVSTQVALKPKGGRPKGFAQETADAAGVSHDTVGRALSRAKAIPADIRAKAAGWAKIGNCPNSSNPRPAARQRLADGLSARADSPAMLEAQIVYTHRHFDDAQERGKVAEHGGARNFKVAGDNLEPTAADLGIESAAKIRLADEYDAAQKRGEVATVGQPKSIVDDGNDKSTAADLGLRRARGGRVFTHFGSFAFLGKGHSPRAWWQLGDKRVFEHTFGSPPRDTINGWLVEKRKSAEFNRHLAAHRDMWWPVLAAKVLSRRQALTMIASHPVISDWSAAASLPPRRSTA